MAEEDMIFGKNRHLFGGIEPSNLKAFTAEAQGGVIYLTAELPDDTIVDGQTLCTVAGAVIRCSTTGYPKNEFDGELFADISRSSSIIDTAHSASDPVYYAAFPYTTQGVYNRNIANRASINTPESLKSITAVNSMDTTTGTSCVVTLKVEPYYPTTLSGIMIRYSTDGYPESADDGTLLEDITSITPIITVTHEGLSVGTVVYYTAFPYDSNGLYNHDSVNRASAKCKACNYLFGYDLDTTNSDPAARVTYPSDVDNANFASAHMDYDNDMFDYGGWAFEPGEYFMPRPCVLKQDGTGTVLYYLDPNDYTKKEDGSEIINFGNYSENGNSMMEWPKIYTKRWEDSDGVYHFRCSDVKLDEDYECWCNYDIYNAEIDHFYTGIYLSKYYNRDPNLSQSIMRSISGVTPTDASIVSPGVMADYSDNNGSGYWVGQLSDHLLIQDLLVMMGKSTDSQTIYGTGLVKGSTKANTGRMNTKGMFWGTNTGYIGVKVFGMEDYWGNYGQYIDGINAKGYSNDLTYKITPGTKDGTTTTGYNTNISKLYDLYHQYTINGTNYKYVQYYISKMVTYPYGRLPYYDTVGSASTYECDFLNSQAYNSSYAGYGCYCVIGGNVGVGDSAGAFFYHFFSYDVTPSYVSSRLSCRPAA